MQQSDKEIVLAALGGTADEKLTSFALRLVLSDHLAIPRESQPDLLSEAEQVFVPEGAKAGKPKVPRKEQRTTAKTAPKKEMTAKKAA